MTGLISCHILDAGLELTYTVTMTNTGDIAYTLTNPATLVDDLLDVVDVADLLCTPSSDKGTAPTVAHNRIVWSGPLAVGETVTITYVVKVKSLGDGDANNYAFATTDPVDPATGVPTNPETGDMTVPPAQCVAPTCASSTATVTQGPTPSVTPSVTPSITSKPIAPPAVQPFAFTGAELGLLSLMAGLLVLAGLVLLLVRRRDANQPRH